VTDAAELEQLKNTLEAVMAVGSRTLGRTSSKRPQVVPAKDVNEVLLKIKGDFRPYINFRVCLALFVFHDFQVVPAKDVNEVVLENKGDSIRNNLLGRESLCSGLSEGGDPVCYLWHEC
jgi:hypothetical protein